MSDTYRHHTEDTTYFVDLVVPEDSDTTPYRVDLVAQSELPDGTDYEKRHALGTYPSYGEAEEHFYEAEQQLQDTGLAEFELEDTPVQMPVMFPPEAHATESASVQVLTISAEAINSTPIAHTDAATAYIYVNTLDRHLSTGGSMPDLADTQPMTAVPELAPGHYLDDNLHPHTLDGEAIPHHMDEDRNSHWFAIVERDARFTDNPDLTHELRYFRARHTPEGDVQEASYPVMPLPHEDPKHAWVLPDLEWQLAEGDLYNAQQLAHDTAMFYGQDFPDPLDLTYFEGDPEYYFEYDVSENDLPALYAVKTWMDGTQRHFDTLTIGEYGMFESAEIDDDELLELREHEGLQAAMNLAETIAVEGGYLDGNRDDPRMFFAENAPPDPFVTEREREIAEPAYEIGAVSANGSSFIDVYKTWADQHERLVIPQPTWDDAYQYAMDARALLENGELENAMHAVEGHAVEAGVLNPQRDDPRLFTQGPPDAFQTLREHEIDTEIAKYGVMWREAHTWETEASTLPDSVNEAWELETEEFEALDAPDWEAETAQFSPLQENTVENPYWHLDTLPVNAPDGEPLGHALHIVVYDTVTQPTDAIGSPEIPEDASLRMMELAHFETPQAAEDFSTEFMGYVKPGVLEGPELAVEVARLEGLPASWQTLEEVQRAQYRDFDYTLERTPVQWRPHNPQAERDARIDAEGLSQETIPPIEQAEPEETIDWDIDW